MINKEVTIFWFRRDLRLEDNTGLYHALKSNKNVLLLFIYDVNIFDNYSKDDPRISFIHQTLEGIQHQLKKFNSSILIKRGAPKEIFEELTTKYKISKVYSNTEYEPYTTNRDKKTKLFLEKQGTEFISFKDQVVFGPEEILKSDSTPYKVYTPYSKRWLQHLNEDSYSKFNSERHLDNLYMEQFKFPDLNAFGYVKSRIEVLPFNISTDLIENYTATRNYPGINKTSKLSPHLRFGTVSIRQCVLKAIKITDQTFLKELIWRSFFIQVLWHYPESAIRNFKSKYDALHWRNNESEFLAWCNGTTGYLLVDAGMRELNATGYMHNRVRMVTASFLCKHLLIDWRWGEAYFAEKLLDFDLAQNVGNWQWVAGTGCDAAPYFRIFNPTEQLKKFDSDFKYIRKWIPDYLESTYSEPIISHKEARERCLSAFKKAT